jgi:hypothetical protein
MTDPPYPQGNPMRDHLDTDLVAAYAEHRLGREERRVVEAHVAECPECRRELADVVRLLRPARARRRLLVALPALAAAAVLSVVMVPRQPSANAVVEAPRLRPGDGTVAEHVASLAVVAPAADAPVAGAGLRFTWAGAGADALYTLTIADTTGRALWRTTTSDTSVTVPDTVALGTPGTHHWWVDARTAAGREASTGIRSFQLAR